MLSSSIDISLDTEIVIDVTLPSYCILANMRQLSCPTEGRLFTFMAGLANGVILAICL